MVHTVTFNQAMLAKDRVFAIRAGTYTSSDIKEASFNYGYISGDTFKPGGTVAGSAKLTFTSIITTFNKLDKIYPEIGLLVGDSYEWVAMGEYFVNDISIDRNRNTTDLDLMDGMFKLNQPYVSNLTYPAQIRDVIREICVKTGVELETDNLGLRAIQRHIEAKADKKDITFREVLSQAIQLLGFSAFFNRRGKLEIRGLTESRITVTADNYFLHGLTKSEIQYQIAGITCKKDKETLTVGLRTGRSLELENSFMNQNLLDDLYYDLKEIKYYPFSLDWQGHLKLDVGQWVTLKTNKNETYKVPVLSQSFHFKGGLKSKISADSKAGNDTQYNYKGFLTKQIEQMSTQIDAEIQQQLEYANAEFDRKAEEYKKELDDDLEKSKADAELYADNIKQEITSRVEELDRQFQTNQQEQDRQIEESLRRAGASTDLANAAKTIAESTQANAEQTRSTLTNLVNQSTAKVNQLEQSVGTIRTDVASQARTLLAQAQAQTDLTNRVTTVENLADGTRSTVSELTKTVSKAAGDIASVTSRTKTVEDTLSQTRTQYEALSQTINTQTGQIDSINRKTVDLQSGIDGVTERFNSLQVGGRNYIRDFGFANLSAFFTNSTSWKIERFPDSTARSGYHIKATCTTSGSGGIGAALFDLRGAEWQGKMMTFAVDVKCSKSVRLKYGCEAFENASTQLIDVSTEWERYSSSRKVQFNRWHNFVFYIHVGRWEVGDVLYIRDPQLEDGTVATTPRVAEEDLRSEIATYVRNASESSAELSRQIQLADGKAVEAKTYAQQTATAIHTRLESLETYKDGESTRASQYFTASRDETARQVLALRTAVTNDYVAKSTFEENARGVAQRFESLRVGGRNLILGTKNFSGTHWEKKGTWRLEDALYKGANILTWVSGNKGSPIANIPVEAGEAYTFSAYIKKENAGTVYFYLYDAEEIRFATANVARETRINNVGNSFQRFSISFVVTRSGLLRPRFAILSTDEGGFSVAGYQLENGTLPTDYNESTEDLRSEIAEYRNTVDGQFVNLQTQVNGKADLTDFQRVQTTSQLYERIIGSTESGVKDKIARMVMADSLFQTEVKDTIKGTATQVSQLADSWAVQNLTSAGTVLNELNLNKDGSVKIDGKLVHITGQTVIDDAAIASAKIASLDASKITSGHISAERFEADSITAEKLKVDRAFFDKLAANELRVKEFFAKDAVVTSIQAVTLSATQIKSGILKAFNDRTTLNLSTGQLTFNDGSPSIEFNSDTSAIRRVTNGQSQFIKFASYLYGTRTTIGANRKADDESIGTADFTGIQIQSRAAGALGLIDKVYVYADEFTVDGGGMQFDGFVFKNREALYPQSSGMLNLGRLGDRWNNVYAFDYYVGQNAVSLRTFLDAVRACFQQIGHGGMTSDTYKLIKDNLTNVFNKIQ
ncbi:TPA: gp58-like family protein [Streptococcus suis]